MLLLNLMSPYEYDFKDFKHCYRKNEQMYDVYLSTDDELSELARLHLLSLRFLIDIRLRDRKALFIDSNEIFEVIDGDKYLTEEFKRKYKTISSEARQSASQPTSPQK